METLTNMTNTNSITLIVTLNVNVLNAPITRQIIRVYQKTRPNCILITRNPPPKYNDIQIKGELIFKNIYDANTN